MDNEMLLLFYRRYSREIYLYLYSLCRSRETAEDLMQDVFLKALLSWKDGSGNLRAWLYKVARNACLNQLQKARRETALEDVFSDTGPTPAEQLLQSEEHRILYEGILTLPAVQREILELFYFSEMSIREIAFLMKMTPENVRVTAHRAKKALRTYMEVNGYEI